MWTLSNIQLTDEHVAWIASALRDPTVSAQLKTLHLSSNQIGDAGAVTLADGVRARRTLTTLHLIDNQIGDAGAVAIADSVRANNTFTTLNLDGNQIGDAGAVALANGVRTSVTLTTLHLKSNRIGDVGAVSLANGLRASTTLTLLNLSDNQISAAGARSLADGLRTSPRLVALHLQHNRIGDAGARAFADAVRGSVTLTTLDLSHNQISDVGAAVLADSVCLGATLKTIDLSGNHISDAGAAAFAESIRASPTLSVLHLSNNQISAAGAAALADGVRMSITLSELYLHGNRIGVAGAVALANGVREGPVFTALDLRYNQIGDAGVVALADGLRERRAQLPFTLKFDFISPAIVPAWLDLLQDCLTLTDLTLHITQFPLAHVTQLQLALRLNPGLTKLDLKLSELDLTWTTANLLPRQDRRRFRALLGLSVPAATGVDSAGPDDRAFYLPWSGLQNPAEWIKYGRCGFGEVLAGHYFVQYRDAQGRDVSGSASVGIKTIRVYPEGSALTMEQYHSYIRSQINELALVRELGPQRSASLAITCSFATHFTVDSRDPAAPPNLVTLLPRFVDSLERSLATASMSDLLRWLADVAKALAALHEEGVVHRNLAVHSIWMEVQQRLVAKLCDFGLSCLLTSPAEPDVHVMDPTVWPPECIGRSGAAYGRGGDVWALGLLMVDVLRRGRRLGHVNHVWLNLPEVRSALQLQSEFDFDDMTQLLMAESSAVVSADGAAAAASAVPGSSATATAASAHSHRMAAAAAAAVDLKASAVSYIDEEQSASANVPLDMLAERAAWEARVMLADSDLLDLPPPATQLLRHLVAWCTRLDPVRRPSMIMVALVLQQVATGQPSCNWRVLPEAIVPARLGQKLWSMGDGEFLAALCRYRGAPVGHRTALPSVLVASDGGAQLLGALWHARQLRLPSDELVFAPDQGIGFEGASALAEGLRADVSVRTLNLNRQSIGDLGTAALAAALHTNTTLTALYLSSDVISDDGAVALADALRVNTTLTVFDLQQQGGVGIGARGLAALASARQGNLGLQQVVGLYDADADHLQPGEQ